jgi:hypothetical protein
VSSISRPFVFLTANNISYNLIQMQTAQSLLPAVWQTRQLQMGGLGEGGGGSCEFWDFVGRVVGEDSAGLLRCDATSLVELGPIVCMSRVKWAKASSWSNRPVILHVPLYPNSFWFTWSLIFRCPIAPNSFWSTWSLIVYGPLNPNSTWFTWPLNFHGRLDPNYFWSTWHLIVYGPLKS